MNDTYCVKEHRMTSKTTVFLVRSGRTVVAQHSKANSAQNLADLLNQYNVRTMRDWYSLPYALRRAYIIAFSDLRRLVSPRVGR